MIDSYVGEEEVGGGGVGRVGRVGVGDEESMADI